MPIPPVMRARVCPDGMRREDLIAKWRAKVQAAFELGELSCRFCGTRITKQHETRAVACSACARRLSRFGHALVERVDHARVAAWGEYVDAHLQALATVPARRGGPRPPKHELVKALEWSANYVASVGSSGRREGPTSRPSGSRSSPCRWRCSARYDW